MKKQGFLSIILAGALLLPLTGCRQRIQQETPNTVPNYIDPYAPVYTQPTGVPLTTLPSMDPVLPELEFNENAATYLGAFNSEIYGRLMLYYQQDRLAIIDPLGDLLFTMYAEGYKPAGADEREAFLYEDETDENGDPIDPEEDDDDWYDDEDEDEDEESPDFVEEEDPTGAVELLAGDINFDGYTDFMLLYTRSGFNSYYFCWLWDMAAHRFRYYLPLSSIPSPTFDAQRQRVISSDRRGATQLLTTDYIWQNGDLVPVGHGEFTIPEQTTHPGDAEDADTSVRISDNKTLSFIEFNANPNSASRWICRIENPGVLRLQSEQLDAAAGNHRFNFRGVGVGVTTVAFRFATSWDAGFVAEKIFNVSVARDGVITIRITE